MMSANTELWGLGVSRDTIRRWQDLGLIASRETPAIADRAKVAVECGGGTSRFGGFPAVVEEWLPALTVEPAGESPPD